MILSMCFLQLGEVSIVGQACRLTILQHIHERQVEYLPCAYSKQRDFCLSVLNIWEILLVETESTVD